MTAKFTEISGDPNKPVIQLDEMESHATEAAKLLRALANENRLMILCALVGKEMSVSDLNTRVNLSQSALSQHLAVLRKDHIVKTRRQSQTILYSLAQEQTTRIIEVLQELYCSTEV
ncbi:MAG: ArsR/SmtB family transcription factor [bacterium]